MLKKLGIGFATWVTAASGLLIGKSSNSNDLVFGNYSDYISSDVAQKLREKYQLRVDLFDYDHLVKERFQKGIYDIAITSTSVLSELKSSGVAMKLDWSKLLGDETISQGNEVNNGQQLNKPKKTIEDARALFTDIVKDMSHDLLEYGIPYFVQKLGFYYRGEKIKDLQEPVTFKTLIEKISNDNRFHSKNGKPQLGLIDDPRTVLSLARKVGNKQDVNPNEDEYKNSESILNDYKKLISAGLDKKVMGDNFLYMTPDSGPMVDALSNKDIQGAFMYNGDGLFAANGGNAELKIKETDFHHVELSENIFFLDFLTFSNKMSEEKKDKAYKLAKDLLFLKDEVKNPFRKEGEDSGDVDSVVSSVGSEEEEGDKPYEEIVAQNFDEVQYTPTLEKVYSALNKYFKDDSDDSDDEELVKESTKHEIIKVDKPANGKLSQDYERQLDSQQKSDMLIAYSNFKLLI
ncbi:hypothetical protein A6V39_02210 [Candidatus Mycoplasma haematobovis]|uniref:Spermidine/putrescine ABC transporter substrate-binding protein n=1 Tax=Candidatus Mycoplasma haematobovis TaxID=432608 RepID=A0A1A9QE49_9MOLU|nr:spermidine/putrescine ABC transporter substrate-binding protein [Candidatus Mycoplasma haematobovis]OAL10235.1 hypothetical protein A6V39_02210 [Candidatus Mycoplasma haematobovis]